MSWGYGGFREYVPVGVKIAEARRFAKNLASDQGRKVQPVLIKGKKIAKTFWGTAWCDHLESFSDYKNRLPRGRRYVRNGSVVDLRISAGHLEAVVGGSEPYEITVEISCLKSAKWKKIRNDCAASIDSLLDLLGGRFSDGVMERLTRRGDGLFPSPTEIQMDCDCPDGAYLCKHLAAVLYGVGAHLDEKPELLFLLRGVDHHDLVCQAVAKDNLSKAFGEPSDDLAGEDLGAIFGIDLDTSTETAPKKKSTTKSKKKRTAKRPAKTASVRKIHSRDKSTARKKPVAAGKKKAARKKTTAKKATRKKATTKKATTKKATTKTVVTTDSSRKASQSVAVKTAKPAKKKRKKKTRINSAKKNEPKTTRTKDTRSTKRKVVAKAKSSRS